MMILRTKCRNCKKAVLEYKNQKFICPNCGMEYEEMVYPDRERKRERHRKYKENKKNMEK
jgi:uncharacterized Zn finger protein (UPF0148 family)